MATDVLAKIKQLDEQRAKLLDEAKATALTNAEAAIAELNSLGFNYRLVEGNTTTSTVTRQASTGGRRSGIRDQVLEAINAAGEDGMSPAEIRTKLGIQDGDKSGAQSVANALSNLKKQTKIADKNGAYYAV